MTIHQHTNEGGCCKTNLVVFVSFMHGICCMLWVWCLTKFQAFLLYCEYPCSKTFHSCVVKCSTARYTCVGRRLTVSVGNFESHAMNANAHSLLAKNNL